MPLAARRGVNAPSAGFIVTWTPDPLHKGQNVKRHLKTIREYVELYRDDRTGIAWIEDGKTGNGHSAHPNIDRTGSVRGMKARGYWRQDDRCIRAGGAIYNVDRLVVTDDLDKVVAEHCRCVGCMDRRAARQD